MQGIEITNDGTKMFVSINDGRSAHVYANIKQYNFGTPYDLSTITLASTAIILDDDNPFGMTFSKDGKKLFQTFKATGVVEQYSLTTAYDLSTATSDGEINLTTIDSDQSDLIAVSFSNDGKHFCSIIAE